MRRRRTPREKKALSYVRDRVSHGAKARHTFRKSWPRKKAAAQRAYRRKLQAEAGALVRGFESDQTTTAPQVRWRPVRKWPAPTLREWIQNRQLERRASHGAKAQRALRQQEFLLRYCDQLLRGFLRDVRVPKEDDLSDLQEYSWQRLRPQLPISRAGWKRFLEMKPERQLLLRAWRRRVASEQAKDAARRRTKCWS
jgi:hypothetical protein